MSALTHPAFGTTASLPFADEALERFFAFHHWAPVATEEVALEAAYGRVIADDFVSPYPVPPRPHSRVDGYALRSVDLSEQVALRFSSELRNGKLLLQSVRRGEAVRVSAGTLLPPGSNVVVPVEATRAANGHLEIVGPVARTEHIMPIGAEIGAKQLLVRSGSVLAISDLGILASFGINSIRVRRRPTVALITFGENIATLGEAARPWQDYDVNRYVIGAVLGSWGAQVVPISAKRADNLAATLSMALRHAEAVVISEDTLAPGTTVAAAIERLCPGGTAVEGIRMTPGEATVIGAVGGSPIIGLPGNPLPALLALMTIGEPIVRRLVGRATKTRPSSETATHVIRGKRGWDCLVPVRSESGSCSPLRGEAGHLSTFTRAHGFVRVPPQLGQYRVGSIVEVQLFK